MAILHKLMEREGVRIFSFDALVSCFSSPPCSSEVEMLQAKLSSWLPSRAKCWSKLPRYLQKDFLLPNPMPIEIPAQEAAETCSVKNITLQPESTGRQVRTIELHCENHSRTYLIWMPKMHDRRKIHYELYDCPCEAR